MASARLRKIAGMILSECNLSRRKSFGLIGQRKFTNKSSSLESDESTEKLDVPLKYTGSKAALWRAQQTRSGNSDDELWYQPYVIMVSLITFMIYFFILREENDIDQIFDKTLYDHIEGLEERHIEQAIKYNREHGIEIKGLEERLKEIKGEK